MATVGFVHTGAFPGSVTYNYISNVHRHFLMSVCYDVIDTASAAPCAAKSELLHMFTNSLFTVDER